jgi:hypothetical protein
MLHMLNMAIQHSASLTLYYIEHICTKETQTLIQAHRHYRGREHTVCYLTAAAMAWLLTGRDIAAPFSDVWNREQHNQGQDKLIAYGVSDREWFEAEHVLLIAHDNIIDSHFMRQQPMMIQSLQSLCEFDGIEARIIYFDSESAEKIRDRLKLIFGTTTGNARSADTN